MLDFFMFLKIFCGIVHASVKSKVGRPVECFETIISTGDSEYPVRVNTVGILMYPVAYPHSLPL